MTDWRPATAREALAARASLLAYVRAFFAERDILEVETPCLARHGVTDLHIQCIEVPDYGFLQSSPEYHMKRLLAAGSGAIWQISRVFRHGEAGHRHNPEFSLLEWYRPGFSLDQLIDECAALLSPLLKPVAVTRYHFRDIFHQHTGLDPLIASASELTQRAKHNCAPDGLDKPALVDWLMATVVEPALAKDQLVVIDDFPGWAAALARKHQDHDGEWVAQRFEIYFAGYELANGYHELTDAAEQAARFQQDRQLRQQHGQRDMAADPHLLAALQHGLPDCSGVAMGLDRVLMAQLGVGDIRELLAFPAGRA
ncbi:MAG: EF-P lysine aminoacylase EpmA [Alcanivoracaceae bacterium]|nr:EF-P lysine aminoacylase EpmA [Alcanivoracaceae bacterium]